MLDKMRTDKKSKCNGECCTPVDMDDPEAVSQFEKTLTQEAFDSEKSHCDCIRKRVECGQDCECDPDTCRNRQMSRGKELREGIDFEERTAWGIDLSTAMNLLDVLPRDIPLN